MKYNFYKDTPLEKTAGKATDKLLDREMQELLGKDYKKKDWSKYKGDAIAHPIIPSAIGGEAKAENIEPLHPNEVMAVNRKGGPRYRLVEKIMTEKTASKKDLPHEDLSKKIEEVIKYRKTLPKKGSNLKKTAATALTKSILKSLKSGKGIKGTAKQLKVDPDLVTGVARKNIQAKTTAKAISDRPKTKKPLNSVKTAKAIKPSPPLYLTMFNCFAFSALPPSKKNAIAAK